MSSTTDGTEVKLKGDGTKVDRQNVLAVQLTLQHQQKHLSDLQKQYEILLNSYRTLELQFAEFQRQRALELAKLLNGGPTSR